LESRAQSEARARAVLEDDELRALDAEAVPDLAVLADAVAAAEEVETTAVRTLHQREEALGALRRQRQRLEDAIRAWGPLREEYLRADSMSKLVRGMGGDNQLQMRLSAYVLATRLDQVVAAANERLAHMRDQRYLLQRTGRAARKGSQAGLGLEVVDQWTGDVRDPATLSGGETFVVSLALALGLADVVTQEAGGTEIETLFVDEGFGTLDADTLDDVMDRLDDLRAGGRAVGVVSHVSEMRNRIPTQLHVEKRRNGSTVAVRTAVG
jgi:exonuclease SbcC